jgi:Type III restriction enzyme, res subunit
MKELNLTGSFYPEFTRNAGRYSDYDKQCIRRTVERLLSTETSADKPGMLLGKIQSGKTKTFLGAIALGFDNGFDIAIILTKGTKALTRQTIERVRREFAPFNDRDQLQIYDIMTLPSGLTGYELSQKLIFVVKKQSDNMDRLAKVFRETYTQLASKRVLIIDDEADYASIGFRNSKEEGLIINRTARQIDALRQVLPESAFLQVTATPYSLYLQPEDLVIQGIEFKPIRPAFTELVPVHAEYIGSDYYFDRSQEHETVASFLYQPLTIEDFQILHHDDRRRFKIEDCLTSKAIESLRNAICNFIVGGCIRRLQDEYVGDVPKKFSFLLSHRGGQGRPRLAGANSHCVERETHRGRSCQSRRCTRSDDQSV